MDYRVISVLDLRRCTYITMLPHAQWAALEITGCTRLMHGTVMLECTERLIAFMAHHAVT